MKREEAYKIVTRWVKSESLIRHMLGVEQCMRYYARQLGENEDHWGLAGLLHDADWEKFPKRHPKKIVEYLRDLRDEDPTELPKSVIQAIASHGNNQDEEDKHWETRTTLMDKCLFACDTLSGFVIACSLVRPKGLKGMTTKSVKKKMKDKSFAQNVSRKKIKQGAIEMDLQLDEHIKNVISALQENPELYTPKRA